MRIPLLTLALRFDHDLVSARQRARHIAQELGFDARDQSRIATAVSELARNAIRYATGGKLSFVVMGATPPQLLEIEVRDEGPGIPHLSDVLTGRYQSPTGMGLGLVGTRRLMDQFSIESSPSGTVVHARKLLPRGAPLVRPADAQRIAARLLQTHADTPLAEVEQQNQELLRALDELRRRQDELTQLNRELEDTNRGVVALYAELDEKADHLRRADELKSRFLSNMTHEFRTPVSSIIAISRILLDRIDGELTAEQQHQVQLIQHAAEDLSELVADLLDLAKVEAGKIVVRPGEFEVADLFAALRGMLRPLLLNQSVALVFEDVAGLPRLYSDESKVSQILRNFVSNALKFTERGEVRVSARAVGTDRIAISVADTGIGIAPEHLETIFEEFSQLEHPVQRKVRGTGLGLPLSRKLATLLGGTISVESAPGVGSTFTLVLPVVYRAAKKAAPIASDPEEVSQAGIPILVVEDAESDVTIYRSILGSSEFVMHVATTPAAAMDVALRMRPAAILLDLQLGNDLAWHLLAKLKEHSDTRDVPVLIVSAIDDVPKGLALGAQEYRIKPVEREWLLSTLRRVTGVPRPSVLVVDDDPMWREVLGRVLSDLNCTVTFAPTGQAAGACLDEGSFDLVCLDLVLPDVRGADLVDLVSARIDLEKVVVISGAAVAGALAEQLKAAGVRVLDKARTDTPGGLRRTLASVYSRRDVQTP
jgi:signal transduction histidine kinase/DNA-binding response OmpR family regulator